MGSVNKVLLIGNLCADVELKYTPSSKAVANLRIATNETWKDQSGAKQERTEFHRVTVWGDQAENCSKYLAKGRSVYIEGKLQTRTYDKDGQKHYATDVIADRVVFLGGGKGEREHGDDSSEPSHARRAAPVDQGGQQHGPVTPPDDDDIPFLVLE